MKRNEPITSIMSSDVATVNVTQKLSDVRRLMADEEIHHVPVVSGRKLVGILSTVDMMRLSFTAYGADQRAVDAVLDHEFSIEQVMRTDLVTLRSTETVRDAARHLRTGQLHSLPVVNDADELVGIVTSTDLIRHLYDQY